MNTQTVPDDESTDRKPGRLGRLKGVGPAFWTFASILSLIVNVILIAVLIVLGSQVFSLKRMLSDQLIGGLYQNFQLMDEARITASIPVDASVPAKFKLPLDTETTVVLSKDTRIDGARVSLVTGGLSINNAPADIVLPAGTRLPIFLKLSVPVNQKIPVKLNVDVDIPLNQTDLHEPFVGLQGVVQPYYQLLNETPNSWQEALCGHSPDALCRWLIP